MVDLDVEKAPHFVSFHSPLPPSFDTERLRRAAETL